MDDYERFTVSLYAHKSDKTALDLLEHFDDFYTQCCGKIGRLAVYLHTGFGPGLSIHCNKCHQETPVTKEMLEEAKHRRMSKDG